jgi:alanine transaminase
MNCLASLLTRNNCFKHTEKKIEETESARRSPKRLTEETMSQRLRTMEYAVRGKVVIKADIINTELQKGNSDYPFDHIVYTNIGNPHSVGQRALTWPRQVLALVDLPNNIGIDNPHASKMFPADAIKRAKLIKEGLGSCGSGAYTHSQGAFIFRKEICRFIEKRDGLQKGDTDPNCIFMTNGASSGIGMILNVLIADDSCGVMIPIPQYPIYSASIDSLGGQKVGYYLDENCGWDMQMEELQRSLDDATSSGITVNSFVLINPGNPTGQVLKRETIQEIVRFCSKHSLVLLADEVYQENIYDDYVEFYSCKKAAHDTGLAQLDSVELVSFHSTSKGLLGECGRRGGYMELVGIDSSVRDQLYKLASSGLCSNVPGQIMTSIMVNGPEKGDVSYKLHENEKQMIYVSLKRRAKIVSDGFNSIPGFSCQPVQGAMYCFPSIKIPLSAIEYARKNGFTPDTLYALSLLENTGICVVPASGFGQEEGRFGFRTTFLPSEEEMVRVVNSVGAHHKKFCSKYQDFVSLKA